MENIGGKTGRGGVASSHLVKESKLQNRQNILNEAFDITKDPFAFKNQTGLIECKICSTTHPSVANYYTHSQAKKHQNNLKRYNFLRQQESSSSTELELQKLQKERNLAPRASGIPEFDMKINRHPITLAEGIFVEIKVPDIINGTSPTYRFVSPYEQTVEEPDQNYQYLVIASPGYENIALKIPSRNIDIQNCTDLWSAITKIYCVQIYFEE